MTVLSQIFSPSIKDSEKLIENIRSFQKFFSSFGKGKESFAGAVKKISDENFSFKLNIHLYSQKEILILGNKKKYG